MALRKKSAAKKSPTKATTRSAKAPARAKPRAPAKARAKPGLKAAPAAQVAERLARAIPEPRCELAFEDGFQLLIATILSAQSTDKAVNAVTPSLFARYPTPAALAGSEPEEVETLIKRTGFFRAKTRSIRDTAAKLVSDFGGEVPRTLDELITLKGVARKTANVVLGTAYGIASGFVVDTHVMRVAGRLGLSQHEEPGKIEQDLSAAFPRTQWVDMGHRILLHGRYTCLAKSPMCEVCPLNELCPSRQSAADATWQDRAANEARRVESGMSVSLPA